MNNAGDKYIWNPGDVNISSGSTLGNVQESADDSEWLGTENPHSKIQLWGDDLDKNIENTKKLYKPSKHGLLTRESEALHHYTGSGYMVMNSLNRHGELPKFLSNIPKEQKAKHIEDFNNRNDYLDSAIKKHSTDHPIHLWRGIHKDVIDKFKEGSHFTDPGFTSTTTHPQVAAKFAQRHGNSNHLVHIKVPKGSSVIHPLSHQSSASRTENEVILPRNSKFRYDGVTEHKENPNDFGVTFVHHLTHIPEGSHD